MMTEGKNEQKKKIKKKEKRFTVNIEGPWDDVQKMDLSLVHDEHGDVNMEMLLEDAQKMEVSLVNDEY